MAKTFGTKRIFWAWYSIGFAIILLFLSVANIYSYLLFHRFLNKLLTRFLQLI